MARYDQLLEREGLSNEKWVRRCFEFMEADLREIALFALADWQSIGWGTSMMFQSLTSMQRPSWGSWSQLISRLRRAVKEVRKEGTPEQIQRLEQATHLNNFFAFWDKKITKEERDQLRGLGEFAKAEIRKNSKNSHVINMPISLRNWSAHNATADSWWDEAATKIVPLLNYHKEKQVWERLREGRHYPSPWFIQNDGVVLAFNGLDREQKAIYISHDGQVVHSAEGGREVQLAFQQILGKTDVQDADFKSLMTRVVPDELKGVLMGDLLVQKPIGAGGFAVVHLGRQLSTGRKVAIKIMRDGLDPEMQQRFQKEATFLSQFDHPNIVRIISYGQETWRVPRDSNVVRSLKEEGWFRQFQKSAPVKSFIAMEWIEGRDLDEIFTERWSKGVSLEDIYKNPSGKEAPQKRQTSQTKKRLTSAGTQFVPKTEFQIIATWFAQSANALAEVHEEGLLHRDLKPSNLMVDQDGTIKLMDFGIARSQESNRTIMTAAGEALGTPAYMSPEQLTYSKDQSNLGPQTDIFSLCATFYELATGTRVYEHDKTALEVVTSMKVQGEPPRRAQRIRREMPFDLDAILMGGLHTELSDRYKTMLDLEDDLHNFLQHKPLNHRNPSVLRRLQLSMRRNQRLIRILAATGTLFFVIAVSLTFYIWKLDQIEIKKNKRRIAIQEQKNKAERQRAAKATKKAELAAQKLNRKNAEDEAKRYRESVEYKLKMCSNGKNLKTCWSCMRKQLYRQEQKDSFSNMDFGGGPSWVCRARHLQKAAKACVRSCGCRYKNACISFLRYRFDRSKRNKKRARGGYLSRCKRHVKNPQALKQLFSVYYKTATTKAAQECLQSWKP